MLYNYCPKCGVSYTEEVLNNFLKDKKRLFCKKCGFIFYNNPKPAVSAIIRNKSGEVLFTKRAIEPYIGWWDLPGGFMEYGESPEEALVREVKEELGIDAVIKNFLGTFHQFYENLGRKDEKYSLIVLIYLIELQNNTEIKVGDDVEQYNFFSLINFPKRIAFSGQRKFIKKVK